MLHDLLGISTKEKRIVSLLGGGGKTTLMFALARESAAFGNTALFTTTNIFRPDEPDIDFLHPFSPEKAQSVWEGKRIVSTGFPLGNVNKIAAPENDTQHWLFYHGDGIYIEADGAKRMPLKYPASWEPVIPVQTTHTIVVVGLSALGKSRESVVHRAQLAEIECEYREPIVTEEGMAQLLWAGYGRFDPVVVLNQADTQELGVRGQRVAQLLLSMGARRVVIISMKNYLKANAESLPSE